MSEQLSPLHAALAAFEIRFEGELTSRWQDLEGKAHTAIVRVPLVKKLSVLSRFFTDAEDAICSVVHEYFPRLLQVAGVQSRYLKNDSPMGWTQTQVLRQVYEFLGLDQKFDETSPPREDSRVSATAARIALGAGWLDEEVPDDFVLPRWVDSRWALGQVMAPSSLGGESDAGSLPPLSRAETLLWIKQQEFWIITRLQRQIEKDSQDGIIAVAAQNSGPLPPRHPHRGAVDERKELIARLKARNPNTKARRICELLDQTIERAERVGRRDNLSPLESWKKKSPGERTWVGLYDNHETRNLVRRYVNGVPALETRTKSSK